MAKRRAKLPTSDLSPEASAERIRKYPPPAYDHNQVEQRAREQLFDFGRTVFLSFFGILPESPPAKN